MYEVIKEAVAVNEVVGKALTADGRESKLETFSGIPPRFEEGTTYTLTLDPNNVIFGEKEGNNDYRHVRLTAVGHSHDTFSIPLSYFVRVVYMRDPARAAFRKSKDGYAILLGGESPHKLSIPGKLNEKELINWLTGKKIIIPVGLGNIEYFQLPWQTTWVPEVENLRSQLGPKRTFEVRLA